MTKEIIGNPNEWHIEVYPRSAGDFGCASISSIRYDKGEAEQLQKEIENSIKRHIDRVRFTNVVYDSFICLGCNAYGETKKECEENCECDIEDIKNKLNNPSIKN